MFPIFKPVFALFLTMLLTYTEPVYQLNIKIDRLVIHKGFIMIAIYSNEKDFLIRPFLKKKFTLADLGKGIQFSELKPGEYAVTLFQDLDGDGQLEKFLSVPAEPYGLSNNPEGFPEWNDTKFTINQNKTITIILKN